MKIFGRHPDPSLSAPAPAGARQESLGRLLLVKILLLAFFLVVALRLIQIQVFEAATYRQIAQRQYQVPMVLPASRGNILDRHGNLLVSNTTYVSFGADPHMVGADAAGIAERFARVFGRARESYLGKLQDMETHFVWLERRVQPRVAKLVQAQNFDGMVTRNEPKRLYHYGNLAGQLIGFTNIDNKGISGVELAMDGELAGANGYVVLQRDGLNRTRPSVDYPRRDPVDGKNVVLTIDLEYQSIAEEELEKGVARNGAEGGLVVMLDPGTGEILAMVTCPSVDPADASRVDPSLLRNRAVTDVFEPGSMFKVVTASAALERHLVKPQQKFFAENGRYVVSLPHEKPRVISDTHPYGMLTFQQAMELSSNIVMAKVSDVVGAESFYMMARNFGFGISTESGLPGEVDGELKRPNQWSGTTLNAMAFGYEVAVTPLQIACAYAAVANKGILMKPYVVEGILDGQNTVVEKTRPQAIRRVISAATAETLTQFFLGVVERGTATPARIPGVEVAGKTGTSRQVINGRYATGDYTASFVGYFPAADPKVVCLVMVDKPRTAGYTGGTVSGPIFKAIAEKVMATSGRFRTGPAARVAASREKTIPDLLSRSVVDAKRVLADDGFGARVEGSGTIVMSQSPPPDALAEPGYVVILGTARDTADAPPGYSPVPDLHGIPIRRALNRLAVHQLAAEINGSGVVVDQSPRAGKLVKVGTQVTLRCEPRHLPAATTY